MKLVKGKKERLIQVEILEFIHLINETPVPDLPNYAVDALWNNLKFLKVFFFKKELKLNNYLELVSYDRTTHVRRRITIRKRTTFFSKIN